MTSFFLKENLAFSLVHKFILLIGHLTYQKSVGGSLNGGSFATLNSDAVKKAEDAH